jgi:hypothetical protein
MGNKSREGTRKRRNRGANVPTFLEKNTGKGS